MEENILAKIIIGAAIKVHKELGPGLLESAYENCLAHQLLKNDLQIEKQKALPLVFQNIKLDTGYRVDLLVNKKVIVEIKSVEGIIDLHIAQVLTYLKLSNCKLGLILNFNCLQLKNGIRRVIR